MDFDLNRWLDEHYPQSTVLDDHPLAYLPPLRAFEIIRYNRPWFRQTEPQGGDYAYR